jgi:hypothetical protein
MITTQSMNIGMGSSRRQTSRGSSVAALALAFAVVILATTGSADAAMTLLTGPSMCSHVGNLVTNGSFEIGAPAPGSANYVYWATGTSSLPYAVPAGWSASGSPNNYAKWGADSLSPLQLLGSDVLPDGQAGLYFGNYAGAQTSLAPTFHPDGRVTFAGTPTMTAPKGAPVHLWQTVPTNMSPAPSYCFSFWASGEWAGQTPGWSPDGIFGLRVTNVLAGDPMQYFAVPGGGGMLGASHRFDFSLVPLNPLLPITIEFVNWGHFDLIPWGGVPFTSELVLDDVMINAVPEPATMGLLALGTLAVRCRRGPSETRLVRCG